METQKINIINNENAMEADILAMFKLEEFNKEYAIYSFNEEYNGKVKIYASTVLRKDDKVLFEDIETEEEWTRIKEEIKKIAVEGSKLEVENND